MHLTLASQSPRRRQMLTDLGIALVVLPGDVDETPHPGESPREYVSRVAGQKAATVDGEVVLAADTAVVLGHRILGKPQDAEDARRMLRQLSGQEHTVLTGVGVRRRGGLSARTVVASQVRFVPLSEAAIEWYVRSGEPLDKAGAYAVQGAGGCFVREISGSVSNVVGLPLAETLELLRQVGFPLPWEEP
jgi:septum formation protein